MKFQTVLAGVIAASLTGLALAQTGPAADVETPTLAEAAAQPESWRKVDPENVLVFDTTKGEIVIEMFPEVAPAHVDQFRKLAQSGDLDGTVFHRVIDDFMAQGGDTDAVFEARGLEPKVVTDPETGETLCYDLYGQWPCIDGEFTFRRTPKDMPIDGIGNPESATAGYYKGAPMATQASFLADLTADGTVESWIPHCPGVVSTARTDDPNSATTQFFLMRQTSDHLDKAYTAWGRVVKGLDVVRAIKAGPEAFNGAVRRDPDQLTSTALASDLKGDDRIEVYVARTDTPEWAARLEEADRAGTNICDLPPVAAIVGR